MVHLVLEQDPDGLITDEERGLDLVGAGEEVVRWQGAGGNGELQVGPALHGGIADGVAPHLERVEGEDVFGGGFLVLPVGGLVAVMGSVSGGRVGRCFLSSEDVYGTCSGLSLVVRGRWNWAGPYEMLVRSWQDITLTAHAPKNAHATSRNSSKKESTRHCLGGSHSPAQAC